MKRILTLTALAVIAAASLFAAAPTNPQKGDVFTAPAKVVKDGVESTVEMRFRIWDVENKKCAVHSDLLGIDSSGRYFKTCIDKNTAGDITVPAMADGYAVTDIDSGAFYECKNLTGIVVEEGIEQIVAYLCYHTNVTYCDLPSTVKTLHNTFKGADKLTCLIVRSEEPPTIMSYEHAPFDGMNEKAMLYVPDPAKYKESNAFGPYFKAANIRPLSEAAYNVWVKGEQVTAYNKDRLSKYNMTFDGDHTLTLNNTVVENDKGNFIRTTMRDFVVRLEGKNSIIGGTIAINMDDLTGYTGTDFGQLTIEGPGSLNIRMDNDGSTSGIGLAQAHCTVKCEGDLRIHASAAVTGVLATLGWAFGRDPATYEAERLTVENANVSLSSYSLNVVTLHGIDLNDADIRLPYEGHFAFPYYVETVGGTDQDVCTRLVISKKGRGVVIDQGAFPDANLVKGLLTKDFGEDGFLTDNEIPAVTSLNLRNSNITSLAGIELFSNLKELRVYYNKLTELDLSSFMQLESVWCEENQIEKIVPPDTPTFTLLSCSKNQLKGERVDELISSLPTPKEARLYFQSRGSAEGNAITKRQVYSARDKNWWVYAEDEDGDWTSSFEGIHSPGFMVYDVKVNNHFVTSDNCTDLNRFFSPDRANKIIEGTVSYDGETNTLTFDHVVMAESGPTDSYYNQIYCYSLNVHAVGDNQLSYIRTYMFGNNLTFTGDGTLMMENCEIGYMGPENEEDRAPRRVKASEEAIPAFRVKVDGPTVELADGVEQLISMGALDINVESGKLRIGDVNVGYGFPLVLSMGDITLADGTVISEPAGAAPGAYELTVEGNTFPVFTILVGDKPVAEGWITFEHSTVPTDIEHSLLNIDHSNTAVYDLQGRRIDNGQSSMINGQLKKGVYVMEGRKIVLR